jgi:hypothetical protein
MFNTSAGFNVHQEALPARTNERCEIFAHAPIGVITEADVPDVVGKEMLPQLAVGQKLVISLFISS